MGRVSKKFLSSSVTKKKSVTSDTFLIDEETSEGGSDIVLSCLLYEVTVTSFEFFKLYAYLDELFRKCTYGYS